MISEHIQKKITEKVITIKEFGINDLTWKKEEALSLIHSLKDDDIGILGGSIYKTDSNRLIPMYDDWYCEPKDHETKKEFYLRSKIEALNYIHKYPVYPNETILFSIVFTEDIDL